MARNWYGERVIHKEDNFVIRSRHIEADIRKGKFKLVLYPIFGYLYFHFIIMGWMI